MHKLKYLTISIIMLLLFSAAVPMRPQAYANPTPVNLLTVENFLALAASTVTVPVGGTTLNGGDLGSNGSCVGFPAPCTVPGVAGTVIGGTISIANPGVDGVAQTDATTVVTDLNSRGVNQTIGGGGLTGLTLPQGVYDVTSNAGGDLTGDLTLNGDANSIFIFRFNADFITSGTARILFTGGAQACNVFWTVGRGGSGQATFDGATRMEGTVFAQSSVDFTGGGATVNGRVIAQTAAITFRNTTINYTPCVVAGGGTTGGTTGGEEASSSRFSVSGLPNTGGAPIRNEEFPWSLVIVAGLSAAALGLGVRSYRRKHLPKQ